MSLPSATMDAHRCPIQRPRGPASGSQGLNLAQTTWRTFLFWTLTLRTKRVAVTVNAFLGRVTMDPPAPLPIMRLQESLINRIAAGEVHSCFIFQNVSHEIMADHPQASVGAERAAGELFGRQIDVYTRHSQRWGSQAAANTG
jgi:hypothetical protein